jgi:hypothetical protein
MEYLVDCAHDMSRPAMQMDWWIMTPVGVAILVGMAAVFWSGRKS